MGDSVGVVLQNLLTGERVQDTLHQTATKTSACPMAPCNTKRCLGSLMNPKASDCDNKDVRGPGECRTPEEMKQQAEDFINQYFSSISSENSTDHKDRLSAVLDSISKYGTYNLTEQELAFGSKMAWRNAARCIGRIQWNRLQVFDYRSVHTAAEMAEALRHHIKFAVNGGNLRSAISVFPQRRAGCGDFRVWNGLLCQYAGFKQADGSVIGDPASVDFTEECLRLGWTPPKVDRFVLLPLVLQADGGNPEMFDVSDLALEVELSHPTYEWFADLKLKWYAVPGVSNIMLDCGGIEFPAVPFNGWYMGTEIGRDLCDENRYNVMPEVAAKMGLNIKNPASLWKDRVLLEVNLAVLHSFQKANITITDHHSASESFLVHMEREQALRGGCPADWVWITPPMSSSITPVFHQEMLLYNLKPSYEYQPNPWELRSKPKDPLDQPSSAGSTTPSQGAFSSRRRSVVTVSCQATILYATETERSATFAKKLGKLFDHNFATKVACMDQYNARLLENATLLIVVSSTFGNGEPPENGLIFFNDLNQMVDEGVDLSNLAFGVFGLGSRMYPNFCAFAQDVDSTLAMLGGDRLLPIGMGDELCGQQEAFSEWLQDCYRISCQQFQLGDKETVRRQSLQSATGAVVEDVSYRAVTADTSSLQETSLKTVLSSFHSRTMATATVISVEELQAEHSDWSTVLVKLSTQGDSALDYVAGDHVAVCPANRSELVDRVAARLKLPDIDADEPCHLEMRGVNPDLYEAQGRSLLEWRTCDRFPGTFSLREALTHLLDITTPPQPHFLGLLVIYVDKMDPGSAAQLKKLEELAAGKTVYEDWKFENHCSLAEVLEEFTAVQLPAAVALAELPALGPRFYSISSSPSLHANEVHITAAVVKYTTKRGVTNYGVASTWLAGRKPGDEVPCFVRHAPSFHMPSDSSIPITMIGPGTGIAPFRSFWQQRGYDIQVANKGPGGPMQLIFGCRTDMTDNIYKSEIAEYRKESVLSDAKFCFSREPGMPKEYVQDHLRRPAVAEQLVLDICHNDGHVYVCGDATMAGDVCKAIQCALSDYAAMTSSEAEMFIKTMRRENRYHEDIFGITLRTGEVTATRRAITKRHWKSVLNRVITTGVLLGLKSMGSTSTPTSTSTSRRTSTTSRRTSMATKMDSVLEDIVWPGVKA